MDVAELIARESIRDAIARYAHCADTARFDELVRLFTEDGVMAIQGREPLRGPAAILAFVAGVKESRQSEAPRIFIRHHVSSTRIELTGVDEARASSYFFAITERGPDHWGRYRDALVRVGELWLFRERRISVDGRGGQAA